MGYIIPIFISNNISKWRYGDSYKGVENTEFVFSFVMEIMKLGGDNHDGKIDLIDIFISLPTFQQIVQKFDSQ